MSNRINFLPPWVETNLQPAFYDLESGTCLQQTSRMYAKVNQLIRSVNEQNETIADYVQQFLDLKDYVEDYFENLDVQTEINNKLDQMAEDGSLGDIISEVTAPYLDNFRSEVESELNTFENTVNNEIIAIDHKVDVATSGSPLVASDVSEMTDHNRIYVNTTNGKWYYWDGDSWEIGGDYQSSGIADGSITIFSLDDMLSQEFIREYENVDYTASNEGFAYVNSGSVAINSDDKWNYAIVNLENGALYEYGGSNYYTVCGLIIADENDDIVFSTRDQSGTGTGRTPVGLRFKTNQAGLKAYISFPKSTTTDGFASVFYKNVNTLIKFTNISQNYKANTLEPIETVTDVTGKQGSAVGSQPTFENSADNGLYIYKMVKGVKYHIVTANLWAVAGIILTDDKYKTTYCSSNAYQSSQVNVDYEFTASVNGYIILTYVSARFFPNIKIVSALDPKHNEYANKTWCLMGDSLTDRSSLGASVDIYEDYVKDKLGLTTINYGHGGAGYLARKANNQAFYQIASTLSNPDVITVFGSFNDTFSTLSTYGWGNTTDHNDTTIFGAMNLTFDNLITNYPNAVIGVIIPTPWNSRNSYSATTDEKEKAEKYVNGLIEICERRSIPYLNLYIDSNLYPWDETFRTNFFLNADGVHPNTYGHKKFSGQIAEFIRSLLI